MINCFRRKYIVGSSILYDREAKKTDFWSLLVMLINLKKTDVHLDGLSVGSLILCLVSGFGKEFIMI